MVRIRYLVSAIILTLILILLVLTSGCKEDMYSFEKFPARDPAPAFDQGDIDYLTDNFSLPVLLQTQDSSNADADVADAIVVWQHDYMKLAPNVGDLSYPMRWNQVMPGIYPAEDLIQDRHYVDADDGNTNKIYGVCWDFASMFAAIARYHGLDVMISAWQVYLSDREDLQVDYDVNNLNEGADRGMSPAESSALVERLNSLGYDIPERVLQDSIFETYVHYRPEVWIEDDWMPFDATEPSGDYVINTNYSPVAWDEFLNEDLCTRL